MNMIAMFPATILFSIEIIQIKEQGLSYFAGWNLTDFTQFWVFLIITILNQQDIEDDQNYTLYLAELRLMLVALTMIKLLFFVRIFEEYGFLVSMIQYCIIDLIPFLVSYMLFLIIFSMLYTVLRMEPDPETAGIQNIPDFIIILLVTFRNAIGEVGLPTYQAVSEKPESIYKSINILLIWCTWYFQTFFLRSSCSTS